MAKNTGKTRVTRRTVIEETGAEPAPTAGDELELPGGDGGDGAPDPEEMDALGKLQELSGGNSMARFEVRRVSGGNSGYAGTLGAEELTMERLAEDFGPGTYTIRVRLPGGKFAGSDRVQIAELPKHRQTAAPVAPAVVSPAAPASNGVGEIIAAMQRSTDSQITMLSGMVKSLIERPLPTPPAPPPPPDTIAILTLASKMFGDRKDSGGFDQFMKGVEFGKEMTGSGETDFGDLFVKGIDGLKELAGGGQTQQRPAARRALPAPGTVPAREAPAAAPQRTGQQMNTIKLLQWLNKQVQHLLVQAARQKDPELYAEVFLDNLPEGLNEPMILAQLNSPTAIDRLAQLNAGVLQYREWFEEFRVAAVKMLEGGDDSEDGEDDGAEGGEAPAGGEFVEFPDNGSGGEG